MSWTDWDDYPAEPAYSRPGSLVVAEPSWGGDCTHVAPRSCRDCDGTDDEREVSSHARGQQMAVWEREKALGPVRQVVAGRFVVEAVAVKHDPAHNRCGWQVRVNGSRRVGDFKYSRDLAVAEVARKAQALAAAHTDDAHGGAA